MRYPIEIHQSDPSQPYVFTECNVKMPSLQRDHNGIEQNNKAGGPQEDVNGQIRQEFGSQSEMTYIHTTNGQQNLNHLTLDEAAAQIYVNTHQTFRK